MNLVDSSGWLEYFIDGPRAQFYIAALMNPQKFLVPTICVYEVFKRVLQQKGEDDAVQAAALMQAGQSIPLDMALSIKAAKISHEFKLPMADSIILAAARQHKAVIWTQDSHFKNFSDVKFIDPVV